VSDQQQSADQRLAEAMASFGRDVSPTDEGWADVVSGRVVHGAEPGRPGPQRFVVGIAAALLVASLVITGAWIGSDDGPGRTVVPASDPAPTTATTTSTTTTSTIPVDPNAFTQACLDGLGVEYRMVPGDGGSIGFSPPASATDEQKAAFTEGVEECGDRLWPEPSPEEQAENVAEGERYTEELIACLVAAGIDAEAVPAGEGAWDIVTPELAHDDPELQSAMDRCTARADANAEARRAEAGDG